MEVTITAAIIGVAINVLIVIAGWIWSASSQNTKFNTFTESTSDRMGKQDTRIEKIEFDLSAHKDNEDKHHNKAESDQFRASIRADMNEMKADVKEMRGMLIEVLANKPRTPRAK